MKITICCSPGGSAGPQNVPNGVKQAEAQEQLAVYGYFTYYETTTRHLDLCDLG